jgi:formamidopyrimidine-DNA glycosylase
MPELPEVETVVRGLRPHLVGRVLGGLVQRRPDLRTRLPRNFAARVEGRRVLSVDRRAKYVLIHLDDGNVLVIHLGMSGRLVIGPRPNTPPGKHDHVEFATDRGMVVRFSDPRRFGMMDLMAEAALATDKRFRDLGPEPLSADFNADYLLRRLKGSRTSAKAALLDQRVVAGLGNIYVCEALFDAGISPRRRAGSINRDRAERLVPAIRDVLTRAIAAGGSSARDYVQASGELGWFQHQWKVYDREGQPCPGCDCGGAIKRIVQAGRSTFYCAKRQR